MSQDRVLTRDFVLVWFASFTEGISWALFIHLAGFLALLGASEAQIGLIFGVAAVASISIRPFVGRMMDHYGRMPVIHVGNVLNLITILLFLTVSTIGLWVYVVQVLHGVALGTLFSAFFTYGADVVPESRRIEGFALFGVSGLLPIGFAGVIGDIVLNVAGYRELFLTAAFFAAAALLLSIPLPERKPDTGDGEGPRGFLSVIKRRDLLPVWWMIGGFAFVVVAYFTFLRTFVDEVGIGSVGLFFGMYAVAAILLRVFFGWLPERVGQKRVLYPSMGCLALGLLLLGVATSSAQVAIAGVLCGVGHGFGFPIMSGITVTRAPDEDRGSAMAFFTALFDVGILVGGPILGAVIGGFGYSVMFALTAVLIVAVTVVFAVWDRQVMPSAGEEPVLPELA